MMHYFAYGSNMDSSRMIERGVEFNRRFAGKIDGWILVFNKVAYGKEGVGYANIIQKESSIVEGVIYETMDDAIKKLDEFEGYPNHYQRKIIPVKSDHGDFDCIVYVAKR